MNEISKFPCVECTNYLCIQKINACSQVEEIKTWKDQRAVQLPKIFDEMIEKIIWILSHREVANKKWFLEQLESLPTFIELKEKKVLKVFKE